MPDRELIVRPCDRPYPVLVAERLRELRIRRGWSMADLQVALRAAGWHMPISTLYAYEKGKHGGGVDMPLKMIPYIALVYGFDLTSGWLPNHGLQIARRPPPVISDNPWRDEAEEAGLPWPEG